MTIKQLKQKLQNPFALVAQGFAVGTIFFWAVAPHQSEARDQAPASSPALPN